MSAHRDQLRRALGDEENRLNGKRRVCIEMEPVLGRLRVVADVLVKLGIVVLANFGAIFCPERLYRVYRIAIKLDGKGDEIGVPLNDGLHFVALGILGVAQVQDNFGTAFEILGGLNFVARLTVTRPLPTLRIRPVRPRVNRNGIRDHEGRVKSDAELTDQTRITFCLFDLLEKRLGAGMRNGAEVLDEFRLRHADTRICNGDSFSVCIGDNTDAQRPFRLEYIVASGLLEELEFLVRVGRVGDEFADKDFLLGIKRVDDDFEELCDFSLEFVFFGLGHRPRILPKIESGASQPHGFVHCSESGSHSGQLAVQR